MAIGHKAFCKIGIGMYSVNSSTLNLRAVPTRDLVKKQTPTQIENNLQRNVWSKPLMPRARLAMPGGMHAGRPSAPRIKIGTLKQFTPITPVLLLPPMVTVHRSIMRTMTCRLLIRCYITQNLPIKPFQKDYGQGSTRVVHAQRKERKSIYGHNMVH